jgi:hypothetical protein
VLLRKLNKLVEGVRRSENLTGGPGVSIVQTQGGPGIFIRPMVAGGVGAQKSCTGGDLLELDHLQGTQDTDTWDRTAENCPVSVELITDWQYDTTSHKLSYRTRTFTLNRCGELTAISAESELVDAHTAEACS